jgi:hypothetical protein
MIYAINIVSKARDDDEYSYLSLNEYPIIYISDNCVEDVLKDNELIDIIKKYITKEIIYNNSQLYIRCIDEYNKNDYKYNINEIYK